jgi:tetratricopeptide (TPR) repeat protein
MRILLIFLVAGLNLQAQTKLTFNKRNIECEDQWVAYKMNEDSSHTYGFIYIDEQAGLTLNVEGKFKLKPDNTYLIEKDKEFAVKVRLEPNNTKIAIIPESMYQDLQIDTVPEWLKYYKTNVDSISRLYKWGYMYNGWNLCEKALDYLLKAKVINPNYEGLAVEIAYSYNCLNEFDEALEVLKEAIKKDPKNAYVNKEYIYTLVRKEEIEMAVELYKKSIDLKIEDTYNAENCFNILGYFYKQKDSKNFKLWKKELKKWPNTNEQITKYVIMMEDDLKK